MKRRQLGRTLCAAVWAAVGGGAWAASGHRIPLADLEAMFADMRSRTRWNVDGPLLWGYYFLDTRRERLSRLAGTLRREGYRVVTLERTSAAPARYQLHVERVELHTAQTLHARNAHFYALATQHGIASYDGMDVGTVATSTKPERDSPAVSAPLR